MRFRLVAIALTGAMLSASAYADPDPFDQIDPQVLLKGVVSEHDVSLLFDYIRSAMFAASQGLPAPAAPEELQQRTEALGNELKARGTLAGLALLNALEAGVKQALREPAPALPPPTTPYTPVQN